MAMTHVFRCAAFGCAMILGLAAATVPARADVSVDGGAFDSKGTVTGGGALSLGIFKVPLIPLRAEATIAAPLNAGGYAATVDARFSPGGTTLGAGIGVGNLGMTTSTNVIYDAILAQSVAPHLSVEARMYFGPSRPSSLFAGLRLTI